MINVMIVDDHPIVRAGIAGLLECEPDLNVVAQASSGQAAIDYLTTETADVVLMDLRMPDLDGVAATRILLELHPTLRVLVFTTYEDDDQILAAIEAGASGYLVKAAPADELIAGVRAIAAGQTVLSPSVATQLVASQRTTSVAPPQLTPREAEVLALVAKGLSNSQIGNQLFISESTVKTHLLHIFEKLESPTRTRAVTRAMELKLL